MADVEQIARDARTAGRRLATTTGEQRDAVLKTAAAVMRRMAEQILVANDEDMIAAVDISPSSKARLKLTPEKIEAMAQGLESLASLEDPLGRVDLRRELDEGLILTRTTVPLGVLGVVFESRPDAAVQIGGLAIKSGNAALLKGGSEARHCVALLVGILRDSLTAHGLDEDALASLTERSDVDAMLGLTSLIDLIIPRGSKDLVRSIQSRTSIPVLGHADGICHVVIDASADPQMAVRIVRDAKLQYPAACNAAETLLVHRDAAARVLPLVAKDLTSRAVELRGDERARRIAPMARAFDDDWDTEYGEPILAVRVVDSLDEALEHIAAHGSGHTEVIVTADEQAAERFQREVDAAGVYVNASSRFADGYRYGFGAEVGISTGRIHARGPVGLEGLVSQKYLLTGEGHVVSDYADGRKSFTHRDL